MISRKKYRSPISWTRFFDLTVFNNDEIAFTWRINTPELVEAYQEGHLKGKLKEIAAGMHEEDNPVIMVAKYKR